MEMLAQDNHLLNWERFNSTLILEVKRSGKIYTSTAVAIGRNMLLTAAHSVDQIDEAFIVIGNSYHAEAKRVKVKKTIIHPAYKPSKSFYENDLAIIILESHLPKDIRIERLHNRSDLRNGEELTRIGFGMRNNENLKTWTNPSFNTSLFGEKNLVLTDKCSVVGDSGGPVYASFQGKLQFIGIHSTLEGTEKTYIVNASKYQDWIESNSMLR